MNSLQPSTLAHVNRLIGRAIAYRDIARGMLADKFTRNHCQFMMRQYSRQAALLLALGKS